MAAAAQLFIILSLQILAPSATLEGLRLLSSSQCACPGDTLTYECAIMGSSSSGGATVWTGTALNCPSDEIVLFHQRFTQLGGIIRTCNHGATVAQSLYFQNNLYTSRLNITITHDTMGNAIMCAYDGMSSTNNVNRDMRQFSMKIPGLLPPPNNFHLSSANFVSKVLTFAWSPVPSDCPTAHYNILASNCGSCPTTTNYATISCTDAPSDGSTCTISLATVGCGNITGNRSNNIEVVLKGNSEYNGAVASSILFAIALFICVIVFTIVIIILLYREKLKVKVNSLLFTRKTTKESTYEDVGTQPPQASAVSADLTRNIAYGHPKVAPEPTCDIYSSGVLAANYNSTKGPDCQ